ncbi:CBS domain-containing protein [Caballeronia sp. DA-9]|uniref:CBS domain-containing protein n=1 Tax=Caballeronia sp. DA-9 TaxID=3436237 RepID=UPI003F677C44
MRALDVMTRAVITVKPETSVREAAALFAENHISGAPVVDDEGRLIGMITEGDLIHRIETGTQTRRRSWWLDFFSSTRDLAATYIKENARSVRDVMTEKVISVREGTPVSEIADLLERHRIKRVPVVYDGELLGIVSRANLVKALASVPKETASAQPDADEAIRNAVLRELANHRWALAAENVIVNAGTVHLWGVVTSVEQARAMCVAAENVPGVKGVEDHTDFPVVIPAM